MVASKRSGHCIPAVLMALLAMATTARGQAYVARNVANCDGVGLSDSAFAYIATAEECEAAAGQVGYNDSDVTRIDTSSGVLPRGCYGYNEDTLFFFFNSDTGGASSSSTLDSFCRLGKCPPLALCRPD